MFGIGVTEIILILIVALVIVGPEKLPELARTIAKGFNEFKRTTNDLKRTIDWNGEGEDRPGGEAKPKEATVEETGDESIDDDSKKESIAPKMTVRKKPAPKKTKKTTPKKTAAAKAAPKRSAPGKESHG